ncbi:MAG: hypothetical protein ABSH32_27065 [Bryobacteraceae bacterium]|jgi:hypothetical protein
MTDEELNVRFQQLEDRILEAMRDMQTELLRGMAAYSASITLRVRKVEADQSNLDAALSGRVDILEKRLGEIEQRLGGVSSIPRDWRSAGGAATILRSADSGRNANGADVTARSRTVEERGDQPPKDDQGPLRRFERAGG